MSNHDESYVYFFVPCKGTFWPPIVEQYKIIWHKRAFLHLWQFGIVL